jgi:hypothetical protein
MWWVRIRSLVGVLTAALAASAVELDDVPIPADTRIVSAPPETPEATKRFLGAWVGSWGGLLHHARAQQGDRVRRIGVLMSTGAPEGRRAHRTLRGCLGRRATLGT